MHYFENALEAIEQGELEKAAESLWGSVAESIKAVAASRGRSLRSHDAIRRYAEELSDEIQDPGIAAVLYRAQTLHTGFYEPGLSEETLRQASEFIRIKMKKLHGLIQ